MKKTKPRPICVIKKGDLIAPEPPVEPPASDRSIMAAVDNWIEERSDREDADRTFSDVSIARWREQTHNEETA